MEPTLLREYRGVSPYAIYAWGLIILFCSATGFLLYVMYGLVKLPWWLFLVQFLWALRILRRSYVFSRSTEKGLTFMVWINPLLPTRKNKEHYYVYGNTHFRKLTLRFKNVMKDMGPIEFHMQSNESAGYTKSYYWKNGGHPIIGISPDMPHLLTKKELFALLAHEYGHIIHRSALKHSLLFFISLLLLSCYVGLYPLAIFIVSIANHLDEYASDDVGAKMTSPEAMARVLEKLHDAISNETGDEDIRTYNQDSTETEKIGKGMFGLIVLYL